jgi:hypothetical protein
MAFDSADGLLLVVTQRQVIGRFGLQPGVGSGDVLLEEVGQAFGGIPGFEGSWVIGTLSCIQEPDTAFLSDLAQKRPAVRREQKRHRELTPRSTGQLLIGCHRIAAAVALGLFD